MDDRSVERLGLLAERLKHGDYAAATELVDLYYERIYLFMRRLGHNRQTSEDLTQESFLLAWQKIGQLRNGKALNGWLYQIAANMSKQYWRKRENRDLPEIELVNLIDDNSERDEAEHAELLCQLRDAVVQLPIKLRETVILHYFQHLTISEAAEAAGVREGTFKSRLGRSLNALKKQVIPKSGDR